MDAFSIHKTFLMEATFFDPRFLNYTYTDNFQVIKDIISSKLQKAKDETNGSDKSEGDKQSIRRSSKLTIVSLCRFEFDPRIFSVSLRNPPPSWSI